jgi:hypothetical protein
MAGKSAGFAIGVGINDAASAGLDALNKRIAALSAPAERFNKSLAKFGEVTGINRAAEGMQTLGDRALGVARAVERLAGPMAGITSAASLGGMVELSRRWADAGNAISKTANLLNTPVDRLSALRGAARLAGSSADALDKSMMGMSQTLHRAFYNHDASAQMGLKALGIDWRDAQGNITTTEDALGRLADKVATYKDKEVQGHALDVVGVDRDLLPLLDKGQAGLDAFVRRARETGGVMTAEMAANAKKMNASWTELAEAIEGVGNRLVNSWSGTATKILDTTSHWIEHNKDLADSYGANATAVTAAVTALSGIKPAVWILRALGLLGPTELLAASAAIGYVANQLPPAVTHDDTRTVFTPGGVTLPFAPIGSPFNPAQSSDDYHEPWYQRALRWIGIGPGAGTVASPNPGGGARGLRNFNPLNLGYLPNQPGVLGREDGNDHRFGVYPSMATGIAADLRQLAMYQSSGLRSVHDLVKRWVSDPNFDQTSYENDVARSIGVGVNDSIDIRDPATAAAYFRTAAPHESGRVSDTDIASGVALGLGYRDVAAGGHVQVDVHLHGAEHGTTASATATGAVRTSPPRIEHSMPMVGAPWS